MSAERLSRLTDEELGEALRALEPMLVQAPPPDVTGEVGEGAAPASVTKDLEERRAETALVRVVAAI